MEFRLAAEGNTDELRQWLRAHPDRVNVPAPGSHMTLLYTAISNANRTDLASLQAGHSRYLSAVRMLCEEYKADVLAPNGGSYNTSLHLAASIGATDIVRYLVETLHTPVDRTNVFGERAVQVAERGGFSECVAILQRAAANQATPAPSAGGDSSASLPLANQKSTNNVSRFRSLTVSDSDDDSSTHRATAAAADPANAATAGGNTIPPVPPRRSPEGLTPTLAPQPKQNPHFSSGAPHTAPPTHPPHYTTQPVRRDSATDNTAGLAMRRHSSCADPSGSSSPDWARRGSSLYSGPYSPRNNESGVSACDSGLPQPVRPRKEYDISSSRILANPDLQGFRSAYGDGFKYIQCSDHYEIRGILPYTYRGSVYYTPVIISVYAPASSAAGDSTGSPTSTVPTESRENYSNGSEMTTPLTGAAASGFDPTSGNNKPAPTEVYCRYRVSLNMQSLNDFAVSRKAEYLDPISGAIIPAPGDDKYQTLTAFIRNVVVRSFESVPPLIVPSSSYAFPLRPNISQLGAPGTADVYRHHHSHNAPAFMKNALPARSAAHIRCATILRELSRFGDGLGRYFPASHRIVAYVPVFSEHKAAVLAMPQERPYTTTVDQASQPATPGGGASDAKSLGATVPAAAPAGSSAAPGRKGLSQQVAVHAVAELQVRVWLQFLPTSAPNAAANEPPVDGREGGVYAYPPRVYLVDAAANPPPALTGPNAPPPNSLTGACFASILRDHKSGEVKPEVIRLSQASWSAKGSVYDILVDLQKELRECLESFAVRFTGRHPASSPVQQANAVASSYAGGATSAGAAAASSNSEQSPRTNALDDFFTTPTTQTQPLLRMMGGAGAGAGAAAASPPGKSSANRCLYCYQPLQTRALLQPCGHDGMCGLCVQRLQSHSREEVFVCPVCRGSVRNVMEVFL